MKITTVHEVQALVRGSRRRLGLSQEALARTAGVSRKWLSEFERGTTTAVELPLVLRMLAALNLVVEIRAADASSDESFVEPTGSDDLNLDDFLRDYSTRPLG